LEDCDDIFDWRPTLNVVGFDVLTTMVMKSSIFWDIMLYILLKVNRRFGGMYLLLQGEGISQARALLITCTLLQV
jgi:hypothetical protein